jgi:hypothetical protein
MKDEQPIILLVSAHASHITPRVIAYTGSQKIFLLKRSRIHHRLADLSTGVLLDCLNTVSKGTTNEKTQRWTLKMCRALLAFYRATIIPMPGGVFFEPDFTSILTIFWIH